MQLSLSVKGVVAFRCCNSVLASLVNGIAVISVALAGSAEEEELEVDEEVVEDIAAEVTKGVNDADVVGVVT